jgi:transcription termination factor Rho
MSIQSDALERSVLEGKDREQLLAIAAALGAKATSRAKKADIIDKILEQTGVSPSAESDNGHSAPDAPVVETSMAEAPRDRAMPSANARPATAAAPVPTPVVLFDADGEPLPEWEVAMVGDRAAETDGDAEGADDGGADGSEDDNDRPMSASSRRRRRRRERERERKGDGPPGAPASGQAPTSATPSSERAERGNDRPERGNDRPERGNDRPERGNDRNDRSHDRNDRTRDRFRDRNDRDRDRERERDRERDLEEPQGEVSTEPVAVSGYLDLRDEGYGFLRVKGYLPSRDDAYVSVKQTRQFGLRKGDHVTGASRPAGRNERNPALLRIDTVNGGDPEQARNRPRFEDLTPLFPDEKLALENGADPGNMTARIVDLIAPIGKGQRGLIVSPPKAGKTTIMKTIATSIERNNPEVKLMVLLVDERPEEVTDMRRTVSGEVIASTFDRPSDEHTHVAELCIERAKRLVEMGQDVVIILDGITRLSRAYNLAAPATGRIMSGGIDAGALYPPKKFFGAARNIEEGGSLTILATALVETNSRMDDAIFEEFKGTGNMELRLDRKLAERRIYPAIDVDASSTRHEELLFDRKQLQMVWKLRRVLSGLAAEGNAAPGLELLIDRLKTFRTNDEFLSEIAKQPSM